MLARTRHVEQQVHTQHRQHSQTHFRLLPGAPNLFFSGGWIGTECSFDWVAMAGLEGPNGGEVKQDGGKRLDPLVLLRKCAIAGQHTLKGRLVAGSLLRRLLQMKLSTWHPFAAASAFFIIFLLPDSFFVRAQLCRAGEHVAYDYEHLVFGSYRVHKNTRCAFRPSKAEPFMDIGSIWYMPFGAEDSWAFLFII